MIVILNLTPTPHQAYRVGVPVAGQYSERLNSDSELYCGSNMGNSNVLHTDAQPWGGFAQSLQLTLPPLAALVLEKTD